jgi:hypothetical protein
MTRKIEITTLRTLTGTDLCADRRTCPGIHALGDRPGRKYVVLKRVTDADEVAAFSSYLADDEILGYAPDELFEGGH